MRSTLALVASLAGAVLAAPAARQGQYAHYDRNHDGSYWPGKDGYKPPAAAAGPTDAQILNYALTLEHLEDKFYREGLANFTEAQFAAAGFDATFYKNLKEISYDETTHVSFLTGALQGTWPASLPRVDSVGRID